MRCQSTHNDVDKPGMLTVQKPIQLLALPKRAKIQTRAKSRGDVLKRSDGREVGLTSFDPGDYRLRYARPLGEVQLGQPPPPTQRP